MAEWMTRMVPVNTHHYENFINPGELQAMLEQVGISTEAKMELSIDWRGELVESKGGGNYLLIGRKGVTT